MKSLRFGASMIVLASFVLVGALGCQTAPPATTTTATNDSGERYKDAYRRLVDVGFNQGDTTIVDSILVENPVDHMPEMPGVPKGRAGLKAFIVMYRAAFPDLNIKVEDMVAEGDRLVAYTVMTGTNTGDFMGMKATGKPVRVEGFDLIRFEGDRMAEHWGVSDDAGMFRQMGVTPPAGAPQ